MVFPPLTTTILYPFCHSDGTEPAQIEKQNVLVTYNNVNVMVDRTFILY